MSGPFRVQSKGLLFGLLITGVTSAVSCFDLGAAKAVSICDFGGY